MPPKPATESAESGVRAQAPTPNSPTPNSDAELARLRWRCRRGMRELDRILEAFVGDGFARLNDREKRKFSEFLEYPDPDLHAYLVGRAEPRDVELAQLLRKIRETVSV